MFSYVCLDDAFRAQLAIQRRDRLTPETALVRASAAWVGRALLLPPVAQNAGVATCELSTAKERIERTYDVVGFAGPGNGRVAAAGLPIVTGAQGAHGPEPRIG